MFEPLKFDCINIVQTAFLVFSTIEFTLSHFDNRVLLKLVLGGGGGGGGGATIEFTLSHFDNRVLLKLVLGGGGGGGCVAYFSIGHVQTQFNRVVYSRTSMARTPLGL